MKLTIESNPSVNSGSDSLSSKSILLRMFRYRFAVEGERPRRVPACVRSVEPWHAIIEGMREMPAAEKTSVKVHATTAARLPEIALLSPSLSRHHAPATAQRGIAHSRFVSPGLLTAGRAKAASPVIINADLPPSTLPRSFQRPHAVSGKTRTTARAFRFPSRKVTG